MSFIIIGAAVLTDELFPIFFLKINYFKIVLLHKKKLPEFASCIQIGVRPAAAAISRKAKTPSITETIIIIFFLNFENTIIS